MCNKRAPGNVFSLTHFCFESVHIRAAKVGLKLLDIFAHVLEPGIDAKQQPYVCIGFIFRNRAASLFQQEAELLLRLWQTLFGRLSKIFSSLRVGLPFEQNRPQEKLSKSISLC